jgi:hypothetical protein
MIQLNCCLYEELSLILAEVPVPLLPNFVFVVLHGNTRPMNRTFMNYYRMTQVIVYDQNGVPQHSDVLKTLIDSSLGPSRI